MVLGIPALEESEEQSVILEAKELEEPGDCLELRNFEALELEELLVRGTALSRTDLHLHFQLLL